MYWRSSKYGLPMLHDMKSEVAVGNSDSMCFWKRQLFLLEKRKTVFLLPFLQQEHQKPSDDSTPTSNVIWTDPFYIFNWFWMLRSL